MKLPLRKKIKKRLPARAKERLQVPNHFTHTWRIDFKSDVLSSTRKFTRTEGGRFITTAFFSNFKKVYF